MYTRCFDSQPFMFITNKSNIVVKLGILHSTHSDTHVQYWNTFLVLLR